MMLLRAYPLATMSASRRGPSGSNRLDDRGYLYLVAGHQACRVSRYGYPCRVAEDSAGERDDDERRERNQRAAAAAAGAAFGAVIAGPAGAIAGAALGPMLEPLVRGVWAELSEKARRRQTDVLFWAIRNGVPVDEMEERINASERTQLLTGFALSAAARTAWEDKVRTLGRSLAPGLLADDNAQIDNEQMIIAAITDIEGPQLAMLELLVAWRPGRNVAEPLVSGPLDLPDESHSRNADGGWHVVWREWPRELIAHARPNLASLAPSLLGTLQRHGLAVQNDKTGEAIEKYAQELEKQVADYEQLRLTGAHRLHRPPSVLNPAGLAPEPTWSPTELGEQVFLRFRDAGTDLDDVWSSGPPDQPSTTTPRQSG
jgi:hypothetical protein